MTPCSNCFCPECRNAPTPAPPRIQPHELRPDAPVSDERKAEHLAALRARLKDPT